jgi:Ser/Thr protein kinase RdoA (MazF antagonist)
MAITEESNETLLRIAREALAAYDLPPPIEVRPIRLINNAVFEVVAEGARRFALRIHRPDYRPVEHIQSELRFLEALADELDGTPVEVPRPIAAHGGELIVRVGALGAEDAPPGATAIY